jgi:branched-chain amino acid transport system permease protein
MANATTQTDIQQSIVQQQKSEQRKKQILNLVLLVLLLLAPAVMYPVFLMKILCFALFAVAFNLLLGYTGLLSFGHAAFLAAGSYTTGYLLSNFSGLTTEMGLSRAQSRRRCWGWASEL